MLKRERKKRENDICKEKKRQMKFEDLGLSERVLQGVYKKGFEEPSPIQAATIPIMLSSDTDIIAQAQTGTGKTAAFGLPLIEMIETSESSVQALILTPTRELAIQVSEEINSLKDSIKLHVIPVYGGQSIDQQLRHLRRGVHIVVGTPGRVIDHINRKTLKLDKLKYLILDEADEMLNMGFVEDMEKIMSYTNSDKKTLLFSATMPSKIKELAKKYMKKHEFISVKSEQLTSNLTEQIYYEVKGNQKFEALCRILDIKEDFYGLVFCRTKRDVDSTVSHLSDRGYDVEGIHGDIQQSKREKTLERFRKKKVTILIATDVAARGIDVNDLSHVINFSLPQDPEAYVHRIGRTGRAGKQGTAITFITPSEYKKLMFIQRMSKSDIKKSTVPNIKDIIATKTKKINEEITSINTEDIDASYYSWAESLSESSDPTQTLAKLLHYSFNDELDPSSYTKFQESSRGRDRDYKSDRTKGDKVDIEGKTRLFVALGKKDDTSPKKLVDFIIKNTGVRNSHIDQVDVYDKFSFITVPFKEAEIILKVFRNKSGDGKSLIVKAKKGRS